MPKGRIQLRLSQTALDHLETRSKRAGVTRQDYIEGWLSKPVSLDTRKPASPDAREPNESSFNNPAREQRKAARKVRKEATVKAVTQALPERAELNPGDNARAIAAATYCPRHRPKYCAPECPHRVLK